MAAARGLTRRALALGAGVAALAGCGGRREAVNPEPRSFAPQIARLPPPAAGQARIVIVRDDWHPAGGEVQVTIDGQRVGAMRDGAVLSRDVGPGRHQLDLDHGGIFDDTAVQTLAVDVGAGGTAWIRLVHYLVEGSALPMPPGQARRGSPAMSQPQTSRVSSFRFAQLSGPPR